MKEQLDEMNVPEGLTAASDTPTDMPQGKG